MTITFAGNTIEYEDRQILSNLCKLGKHENINARNKTEIQCEGVNKKGLPCSCHCHDRELNLRGVCSKCGFQAQYKI